MRLGGPIFNEPTQPDTAEEADAWAQAVTAAGYRAAYCPLQPSVDNDTIRAFAHAAAQADIVIAEVGAWSNPLSPDDDTRTRALDKCKQSLALAETIGARCCVNIAGSRGSHWAGPHPDDLSSDTFDMIVACVRDIIDDVQPRSTSYALETMPWMYPDATASYQALLHAIDRPAFAVHFDPVNLVNSPNRYFNNADLIREFVDTLGPHIRSCHAKDILLHNKLTVHLDEVRPGLGALDYPALLRALDGLPQDVPIMLEHLPTADEYHHAATHLRSVAKGIGLSL